MVVSLADILLLVIAVFGGFGVFRGVRAGVLTTGAIFFAFVVVVLAGDLVIDVFRRLGVPLAPPDTQALFKAALFIFTLLMASRVLAAIVAVPKKGLSRREKLWGLVLGLLNGFFIVAIIERYLIAVIQAMAGKSMVSVGVPALSIGHAAPDTWSVRLVPSSFTLLPPAASGDLWARLPLAWPLLLPVLALGLYALLDGAAPGLRLSTHVALFLWVVGVAAACYLVKWLVLDLLPWSRRVYVLTNRRIITQSGVLAVYRRECSLLKIEESDYVMRGLVARLLNFGDVEVRPSGGLGAVVLGGVGQPGRVQALISAQAREAGDEVAQHHLLDAPDEVVRRLEVIVRGTPPSHSAPTAPLQPVSARAARTRPAPRVPRLNLLPGEDVVDVTRQHPIVLASGLRAPLL